MTARELALQLGAQFPGLVSAPAEFRGEITLRVAEAERMPEVCAAAKAELGFDYLVDMTSVDNYGQDPRFTVVYHLYSYRHHCWLRLKTAVSEEQSELPTVTGVWRTADWHEREIYDMMGLRFRGHPDLRRILMWEDAEGGLGVLRRLVDEPDAVAAVARDALDIMHFDPDTGEDSRPPEDEEHGCAKACYDCLLTYYNQRHHKLINRHCLRALFLALTDAATHQLAPTVPRDDQYARLIEQLEGRTQLERELLDYLHATQRRLPDHVHAPVQDVDCTPDFYFDCGACVFCDEPGRPADPGRKALADYGYRVLTITRDEPIEQQVARYPDIFGQGVTDE